MLLLKPSLSLGRKTAGKNAAGKSTAVTASWTAAARTLLSLEIASAFGEKAFDNRSVCSGWPVSRALSFEVVQAEILA